MRFVLTAAVAAVFLVAAPAAGAAVTARGSVGEAYVTGAAKGASVTLLDRRGKTVGAGKADRLGSKIFRDLAPGPGYRIKVGAQADAGVRRAQRRARTRRSPSSTRRSSSRASTTSRCATASSWR